MVGGMYFLELHPYLRHGLYKYYSPKGFRPGPIGLGALVYLMLMFLFFGFFLREPSHLLCVAGVYLAYGVFSNSEFFYNFREIFCTLDPLTSPLGPCCALLKASEAAYLVVPNKVFWRFCR